MTKIFISRAIPKEGTALLQDAFGPDAVTVYPHDRSILRQELAMFAKGCDALLPMLTDRVDAEIMDAAGPALRVIANYAVGFDNIDVPAAVERDIWVTNTPDVLTEATADLAWMLLLSAARRVVEGDHALRRGQWSGWAPQFLLGVDVFGKTLGIFGMGRIGQAVARRAAGFGMRVLYTSRTPLPPSDEHALNAVFADKATLLRESDFISIHCPLTPETHHAFGASEFLDMKPSAVLVNTARGPVVDEAALVEALHARAIFAAGLDVYEREPQMHPGLRTCPNVVLAPHLGSATVEARARMAVLAAENIVAALNNAMPPNCVNPEAAHNLKTR